MGFDPKDVNFAWHPSDDRIVALPLLQATPSAEGTVGILLTDQNRERPVLGIVLAVGPGGTAPETGRPVTVKSQVGELVAFGRYAGMDFEASTPQGYAKVLILRDCEVLLRRAPTDYELVVHEDNPAKMHEAGHVCDLCRPKVDVAQLQDVAYGDVIDAEAPAEPAVDPAAEEAARQGIEAERDRLRQLREGEWKEPAPAQG